MIRDRHGVALIVAAACWGSDTVAVKYALRGIPAMTLLMIELVCATAALWTVLLIRGHRRPAGLGRLALLGLFEPGLAYAAINLGLIHTTASDASLLSGTESAFVVVLAAVFLGRRFTRGAVAAVVIATVGVAALSGSAPSLAAGWGDGLVLAGSLSAAIYVTLAGRIAPELDSLTMTAYQFLAGTAVSVPFALAQWASDGTVLPAGSTPGQWAAAVGAGVVGLALSFLLYNRAIGYISATTAGMVLNLIPLFGLAAAVLVLGEPVDAWQGVGALLILSGLVLFTLAEREPPVSADADVDADPYTEASVDTDGRPGAVPEPDGDDDDDDGGDRRLPSGSRRTAAESEGK
ncbi:DMT family transporter [Actinacidiphila sp. ITFR-21]|uniref:DMT family transporter n=1 Tax=Actinacidiphila sp. ITFR-21 TaxID=3075199 RepID=UPI00288B8D68|nr:DMT family transporter [Streptomyces sp. ITFR-21]WNI16820.1 DMT family transporter [Streptomyces sp. ITFR-21]